ncbi:MAG: L-2-amino-thiazoline-4-carboxylic acid hydrolase [Oscillospiraceae bacterium]|nr:L-2-amino-thiazoline-4-carboxylic acid hydrolase [Oscillospiraceae bacterium]
MSDIKSDNQFYEEKININRKAIEHRATWMALMFEEAEKEGAPAEKIARNAVSRTGSIHGADFKKECKDPEDLKAFKDVFLNDVGVGTFEMDVQESTEEDLKIEFHHCPLVDAWKKLDIGDEECAKLCDIAMDGDRGIAKAMGYKFDLTDTIAKGDKTCKLHFYK